MPPEPAPFHRDGLRRRPGNAGDSRTFPGLRQGRQNPDPRHLRPSRGRSTRARLAQRRLRFPAGDGRDHGDLDTELSELGSRDLDGQGTGGSREDPGRRRGRADGRLHRLPAQLLEPRRPDGRRVGQAHALRRFPVRRERRLPRLHGRFPPQENIQPRVRRFVPERGPRRRRPGLRHGEEERSGRRVRRAGRIGTSRGDARAGRPLRRGRRPGLSLRRRLPAEDEGVEDPGRRRELAGHRPGRRGRHGDRGRERPLRRGERCLVRGRQG